MKQCAACCQSKPFDLFPKNKAAKDGYYRLCKACNAEKLRARNQDKAYKDKRAEYLAANRQKANAYSMASYHRHIDARREGMRARRNADKDARIAAAKQWRLQNPERVKANRKRWFAERPGYCAEKDMRRYASKVKATPQWADLDKIREVYALAAEFRAAGFDVHVDHVVPLCGREVTGLHVHHNLRILMAAHNRAKSNRLDESLL